MKKAEFRNEMDRLARGFSRPELTDERLFALYERFQHIPLEAWQNTVSSCLCDDRYPSADRLSATAESCWQNHRARLSSLRDQEARQVFQNPQGKLEILSYEPDPACTEFYRLTRSMGVPPAQAAEVLGPKGSLLRDYVDLYGQPPFKLGLHDYEIQQSGKITEYPSVQEHSSSE